MKFWGRRLRFQVQVRLWSSGCSKLSVFSFSMPAEPDSHHWIWADAFTKQWQYQSLCIPDFPNYQDLMLLIYPHQVKVMYRRNSFGLIRSQFDYLHHLPMCLCRNVCGKLKHQRSKRYFRCWKTWLTIST